MKDRPPYPGLTVTQVAPSAWKDQLMSVIYCICRLKDAISTQLPVISNKYIYLRRSTAAADGLTHCMRSASQQFTVANTYIIVIKG